MQATFTMLGPFPGTRRNLMLRPQYKADDPGILANPAGVPGTYKVIFALMRFQQSMLGIEVIDSDSLIKLADVDSPPRLDFPYVNVVVDAEEQNLSILGYANSKGRLSTLVIPDINALNLSDASEKAERTVYRFLSQLSTKLHVPINIGKTEVLEFSTSTVRVSLIMPYDESSIGASPDTQFSSDSSLYASLYREALNTNSPMYRFLCMFKVIDGINARRNRRGSQESESYRAEVVPGDLTECRQWLTRLFDRSWDEKIVNEIVHPEIRGRKFSYIVSSKLSPIRIKIAHSVLKGGEPALLADEPTHLNQVYSWLPLTQCLARHMFNNEFA
jgi:hypothetical protein